MFTHWKLNNLLALEVLSGTVIRVRGFQGLEGYSFFPTCSETQAGSLRRGASLRAWLSS
jgi:hypothetical protein